MSRTLGRTVSGLVWALSLSTASCTFDERPPNGFVPDAAEADANPPGDRDGAVSNADVGSPELDGGLAADAAPGDAAPGDGGLVPRLDYCAGSGPPILFSETGEAAGGACTGEIAQVTFRYALCSCGLAEGTDELRIDGFDSRAGPYATGGLGGGLGTNGIYRTSGESRIGGALWIAGAGTTEASGRQTIRGELRAQGNVSLENRADVERSVYVGGNLSATDLTIAGDLHIPEGRTFTDSVQASSTIREPVTVARPCACEPAERVDIAGYVAAHQVTNDNADFGLAPDALRNVTQTTTLALPCGRFFLSEISGAASITLTVSDRSSLFIGGDIRTTGALTIELADGAEVDVFVAGTLAATGALRFGASRTPAKARLYIGSAAPITIGGTAFLSGNIYAPSAEIAVDDAVEIYGSLFAGRVSYSNKLTIHYDHAVLTAGEGCEPSSDSSSACARCEDCGNQACVDGVCGSCTRDEECCSPLACRSGRCVPNL